MKHRIVAIGLVLATALAGFAPTAAFAGEKQAKNAAIAATVVSGLLLTSKKTRTAGIVGAAGSAYLWKKYSDSRKARERREDAMNAYYRRVALQSQAKRARTSRSHSSHSRRTARR